MNLQVIAYRLPFSRYNHSPDYQTAEIVATKFDGGKPSQWAIREGGMVMAKDGEWEYEPLPSSRTKSFLSRTRFATAEKAEQCAMKFHKSTT